MSRLGQAEVSDRPSTGSPNEYRSNRVDSVCLIEKEARRSSVFENVLPETVFIKKDGRENRFDFDLVAPLTATTLGNAVQPFLSANHAVCIIPLPTGGASSAADAILEGIEKKLPVIFSQRYGVATVFVSCVLHRSRPTRSHVETELLDFLANAPLKVPSQARRVPVYPTTAPADAAWSHALRSTPLHVNRGDTALISLHLPDALETSLLMIFPHPQCFLDLRTSILSNLEHLGDSKTAKQLHPKSPISYVSNPSRTPTGTSSHPKTFTPLAKFLSGFLQYPNLVFHLLVFPVPDLDQSFLDKLHFVSQLQATLRELLPPLPPTAVTGLAPSPSRQPQGALRDPYRAAADTTPTWEAAEHPPATDEFSRPTTAQGESTRTPTHFATAETWRNEFLIEVGSPPMRSNWPGAGPGGDPTPKRDRDGTLMGAPSPSTIHATSGYLTPRTQKQHSNGQMGSKATEATGQSPPQRLPRATRDLELQKTLGALQTELNRTREAFEAQTRELVSIRSELAARKGEEQTTKLERDDLRIIVDRLLRQVESLNEENVRLRQTFSQLESERDEAVTLQNELRHQLQEARRFVRVTEAKEARRVRSNTLSRLATSASPSSSKKLSREDIEDQLKAANQHIRMLERELSETETEKNSLQTLLMNRGGGGGTANSASSCVSQAAATLILRKCNSSLEVCRSTSSVERLTAIQSVISALEKVSQRTAPNSLSPVAQLLQSMQRAGTDPGATLPSLETVEDALSAEAEAAINIKAFIPSVKSLCKS